jgi:F0F1-type ATP synthase assembly protein I
MNQGMRVLSYLISGVLVYGLLGWLGDHYLGTRFLLPVGIVGGAALGVFIIIRRFGRVEEDDARTGRGKR